MSLRLDIKKKLLVHSPRVKSVDFHPELPWLLCGLYSGTVSIHDYQTQSCIKTLEVCQLPVRTARFLAKKQWILTGSDDMILRVFNYNTMERIHAIDAHKDFIRGLIVHPQEPYVLTCSDDTSIKVWNYEKQLSLVRTLTDHKHFVMNLAVNPRDLSKFASASMDKTIKIWSITADKANFTLTGHLGGVNTVDFFKGDKPYIVSGSDDKTIKIWDFQTKQCISTLQGHLLPITSVVFHHELPILLTTSQNGKVIVYNSTNFAVENTLEYNLDRCWCADISRENPSIIAFGYDQGTVAVKIGPEEPVVSLSAGKLLWTKSMEVLSANLKALAVEQIVNQQKINMQVKELGTCEMFPTYIKHSPNGHFFGVCNDREFVVLRTANFKNVKFGTGTDLSWSPNNDFAVRDNSSIKVYKDNELSFQFKPETNPIGLYGGPVLTVVTETTTTFFDWETLKSISTVAVSPKRLIWSDEGKQLALLTVDRVMVCDLVGGQIRLNYSIQERATSGVFVNGLFFYMSTHGKLYFSASGGKSFFYYNSDKRQLIVGSLQQHNKIYTFDKNNCLYSYEIPYSLASILNSIATGRTTSVDPNMILPEYRDRTAKFLDAYELKQEAFRIVSNQDHKFELAVSLGYIDEAFEIACKDRGTDKLKLVGDIALGQKRIELAIDCYNRVDDLNGLFLIYSSLSLPKQLEQLGQKAQKLTRMNIAFQCYYMTNQPKKCLDILIKSKRFPEAALFARTYIPSEISECVKLWKQSIDNKTISNKISDPTEEMEEEAEEEQL